MPTEDPRARLTDAPNAVRPVSREQHHQAADGLPVRIIHRPRPAEISASSGKSM